MSNTGFNCWAVVEVMGHKQFAGLVTEQEVGGTSFVRIDVPEVEGHPAFTKLFGAASIYCITPTTEDIAKAVASGYRESPVSLYGLPDEWREKIRQPLQQALPSPVGCDDGWEDDESDDDIPI